MSKSCENCKPKLGCKAYVDLNWVLTENAFCGMIKDVCERVTSRSKIYAIIGGSCDLYTEPDENLELLK